MGFPHTVPGRHFEASDQHDVNNLVVAVGLVNNHLASGRSQSNKIFMFDTHVSAIGKMHEEGPKWLGMEELANVINFHARNLRQIVRRLKSLFPPPSSPLKRQHDDVRGLWLIAEKPKKFETRYPVSYKEKRF